MVSFELGKEIEKDVFPSFHKRGKKKILSPHEESTPQTFGFHAPMLTKLINDKRSAYF